MNKGLALKKLIVAICIIGTFLIYSFLYAHSDASAALPKSPPSANVGSPSPTSSASGDGTPAPTATITSSGLKDGAYTGNVTDAQWGYVQVKAIIQGGRITDVQWVQYPSDRSRSVYINSIADPQLTSEAIQAQSSQVDIVTGATDSSIAFMESLANALTQAQA